MYKVNTILTLADLSANSTPVLETALRCADFFSSKVLLYHASPNLKGDSQIESLKNDFDQRIKELKEDLDVKTKGEVVMIANEDFPSGMLLKQLISDADLVVIGGGAVKTRDVKREKIIKIVDMCDQPVMVVPSDKTIKFPKKILYCSDYSDLGSDDPLNVIKYMAQSFDAEVRLAHVKTHDGSPNKIHAKRSRYEGNYFEPEVKYSYKLIRNDDVIDGISSYVKKKGDNDIMVLVRRKHHIFDRVFGKNFTFRMLQNTEIPLLILKETQLN